VTQILRRSAPQDDSTVTQILRRSAPQDDSTVSLVAEVADAGEDHGEVEAIGGGDDVLVADRASGLDDGGGSGLGYGFESIGKGKEGVGGGDAALEWQHTFHGAEARGVDAAHLACAHADGLAVARVDDGVRLDVLDHFPGKEQGIELVFGRRAVAGNFQIGDGQAEAVGILEEKAAGNLAEDAGVVSGPDDDEAQVLLRFETIEGVVAEAGSGDGFDEEVSHFLGGIAVHFAIQADDGAEGGDRVGDEALR